MISDGKMVEDRWCEQLQGVPEWSTCAYLPGSSLPVREPIKGTPDKLIRYITLITNKKESHDVTRRTSSLSL